MSVCLAQVCLEESIFIFNNQSHTVGALNTACCLLPQADLTPILYVITHHIKGYFKCSQMILGLKSFTFFSAHHV